MPRKLKKTTKRRRPKQRIIGRAKSAASTLPSGLQAGLIRDIQSYHRALTDRRAEIDGQIMAIEQALGAFGVGSAKAARPTSKASRSGGAREGSLKDYVGRVLAASGSAMMVKDIAAAVVKSGYKTKNKTLATSVGLALADMGSVKRVSRGQYRLK
jgi:hypothetical protein